MSRLLLAFALVACESRLGQVGYFCLPDGGCVSDKLECVAAKEYLGIPVTEPTCKPKRGGR